MVVEAVVVQAHDKQESGVGVLLWCKLMIKESGVGVLCCKLMIMVRMVWVSFRGVSFCKRNNKGECGVDVLS